MRSNFQRSTIGKKEPNNKTKNILKKKRENKIKSKQGR